MIFYIIQLITFLFAFFNVKEQVEATYLFSQTQPADYADRKKKLHDSNFLRAGAYALVCALTQHTLLLGVLAFLVNPLLYYVIFTIGYNEAIGKGWDYLGETASSDKWIRKTFGEKGMRKVLGIAVFAILITNALLIIF